MTGVSLPFAWLIGGSQLPLSPQALLPMLRKHGVSSIELRTVEPYADPESVRRAAELLWNHGFSITIHGRIKTTETAVEDLFAPLAELLPHLRQQNLTLTIHPINCDNAPILCALSDYAAAHGHPVTIALENNRLLPSGEEGDAAAFVLDAVTRADRKNVGICFDFGHYTYYWKKNHPDTPFAVPNRDFFRRVVHTHIHAVNGLKTHFPLHRYELPLQPMLCALEHGYLGVYNAELDFPRFSDDPVESLLATADILQDTLPVCARLYDDLRTQFDRWFLSAASVLTSTEKGTQMGLIHATSYLFSTNGYPWAMDIAFRKAWHLCRSPRYAAEILRPLKLMILSHGHGDHFEEETIRVLAGNDMDWVVPDFLAEQALSYGIARERMHIAAAGEPITAGPLTILPFEGRHYRPITHTGAPAYGYLVTSDDAPSLVFPGDTRDFALDGIPKIPEADYCFAHVWLGDNNCLDSEFPLAPDFAAFMLQFSRKNIFLTHLYENERPAPCIWQAHHAHYLADVIHSTSPDTHTIIPAPGDVIRL